MLAKKTTRCSRVALFTAAVVAIGNEGNDWSPEESQAPVNHTGKRRNTGDTGNTLYGMAISKVAGR